MNRVYQLLLVLGCVMGLTVQAHAESLYVKSSEARVMKTPSFSATMISKLKQGSEVDVIKRLGSWVEIAYGAEQGWISKFQLGSNTPPRTTINLLDTLKTDNEQPPAMKLRRRASAYSTAAAARGLAATGDTDEKGIRPNYQSLEHVESFELSEVEIESFSASIRQ
jgi:uncharacterized protein YgiM (DUF1202 family)